MNAYEKFSEGYAELRKEASELLNEHEENLAFYSWPQTFANTSGPQGGIGGQALRTFPIFAFESPSGDAVVWCVGVKQYVPSSKYQRFGFIEFDKGRRK